VQLDEALAQPTSRSASKKLASSAPRWQEALAIREHDGRRVHVCDLLNREELLSAQLDGAPETLQIMLGVAKKESSHARVAGLQFLII